MQAIKKLTASLAVRGIGVITSEGTPLHIDHINATDSQELVVAAAKSYVDWYMLTQVGGQALMSLLPLKRPLVSKASSPLMGNDGAGGTYTCEDSKSTRRPGCTLR